MRVESDYRRRAPLVPILLVVAYAALGISWAMTNAPFTAPDESQHYLRALDVSTGRLVAPRVPYTGPILSPQETEWRRKLTRAARVPAGLSPDGLDCELFHPETTPRCADGVRANAANVTEDTDVGSYPPIPYLLPALAVRLDDHPAGADRAGRLAMVLLWAVLLSCAALVLWDVSAGGASLLGLVVGITPTAVFMGSSLSDSSVEIMASVACFAALLRLVRPSQRTAGSAWALAAVAAALLVLSRSLGPIWLTCELVIVAVLAGGSRLVGVVRDSIRSAAVAAALVLAGLILFAIWERAYGPRIGATILPPFSALHDGESQLRVALKGVVGVFGYEDVPLGAFGVVTWSLLAAVLLGLAIWLGTRREKLALLVAVVLAIAVPIYAYAAVTRHQGIETQGRHILPLFITIPLLCGEIVRGHVARLASFARWLFPVGCVIAAGIQFLAWWENSRRYAVGLHGPWWFVSHARWSPPGGWTVWVIIVTGTAAATALGSVLSVLTTRGRQRAEHA